MSDHLTQNQIAWAGIRDVLEMLHHAAEGGAAAGTRNPRQWMEEKTLVWCDLIGAVDVIVPAVPGAPPDAPGLNYLRRAHPELFKDPPPLPIYPSEVEPKPLMPVEDYPDTSPARPMEPDDGPPPAA